MGRRRVELCAEGWYYLFVLAFIVGGATLRSINLLYLLAGIMIGPLLWNWRVVVLSMRQLQVQRRLPAAIVAGRPIRVEIEGINHRRRLGSWMVVVQDSVQSGASGPRSSRAAPPAKATVILPYLASGASGRTAYEAVLPLRGWYEFGPLHVSTRFPLGLVRGSCRIPRVERVVVWPRIGQLSPRWLSAVSRERAGRQPMAYRHGPIDGDYYGLREWRPGDSLRWIHWRTTAKLGRLTVRQFEQLQNQDLTLILDLWQPEPADEADQQRVERAVSFAATVVDDVTRRGASRLTFGLAARGHGCWTAKAASGFSKELMDRLAVAEAADDDGLAAVLRETLPELAPGSRAIVVSTRSSQVERIGGGTAFTRRHRHLRALSRVLWLAVDDPVTDAIFQLDAP